MMLMRLFIFLHFAILLLLSSAYAQEKPRVLVIDSYHAGYFWTQETRSGIQSSLHECCEISFFEMNTKNIPENQFQEMADKAWKAFDDIKPDGVILSDDNAVKYLGRRIAETGVPVSYLGVNENPRDYFVNQFANVSGVLGRTPYRRNISLIGRYLKSGYARVLVLFDNSVTANAMFNGGLGGIHELYLPGVQADIELVNSYADWQELVLGAQKNGYDALVLMLYHRLKDTGRGDIVDSAEVLKWTVNNSPVPPFGIWKFSIDGENGVIGGLVAAGYPQGYEAGETLKEMIFNQRVAVPVKTAISSRLMFSKKQLEKWQIDLRIDLIRNALLLP